MATPDMEVIKEIPGYKVILKAVLKSQIQQLVEHLASFTEEESVILTASVSDGTLSHLGSDSGKFFLDDHEDIKSQFLGFCLKRHHRKKQEKEKEEQEAAMRAAAQFTMRSPSGPRYRAPRMSSPRQSSIHPVALTRAGPGSGPRGQFRHEPYTVPAPRRTSLNFDSQSQGTQSGGNAIVKIEPREDNGTGESDANTSLTPSKKKLEQDDENKSNSSSSTIPNEATEGKLSDNQPPGGLSLDSDLSSALAGDNSQGSDKDSASDTGLAHIKVEALSEADMELEITGVEPGRPAPQENWGPSTSAGIDQSTATGSPGDMQGYNDMFRPELERKHVCDICGKKYGCASSLKEHHAAKHSDKARFTCTVDGCGETFQTRATYRTHWFKHYNKKEYECDEPGCDKSFNHKKDLKEHIAVIHRGQLLKCHWCDKTFRYKKSLEHHMRTIHAGQTWACDICGQLFSFRTSIQRHKNRVHKDVMKKEKDSHASLITIEPIAQDINLMQKTE